MEGSKMEADCVMVYPASKSQRELQALLPAVGDGGPFPVDGFRGPTEGPRTVCYNHCSKG